MHRLAVSVLVLLAACAGGPADPEGVDGSPSDTDDPAGSSDVVSVDIDAAAGGTVATDDGATLVIPPGSLGADTTVTVASSTPDAALPELGSLIGNTYEFGPDGTTFAPAAVLGLPLVVAPGEGEVAVVSWLDESAGVWVDLPTTVSGDVVSAEIAHFTLFVVRIVGESGEPPVCTFDEACGGDVVGTWTIDGICLFVDVEDDDLPTCLEIRIDAQMEGDVTFAADHSYSIDATLIGELQIVFKPGCLDPSASSCDYLDDPEDGMDCSGSDPTTECICRSVMDEEATDSGTWSTNGGMIRMEEQGSEPSDSEFCVNGDAFQLHDLAEGTVVNLSR